MRDVTLYQTGESGLLERLPENVIAEWEAVPAVVGVTVAEVDTLIMRATMAEEVAEAAERERDEARTELEMRRKDHEVVVELAAKCDAYREALERIMRDEPIGVHEVPVPPDVLVAELRAIAREALGGGE